MIEIKNKQDCCGCESCYNACPLKCITMVADEEGFKYPHINLKKCINCGKCENSCPVLNAEHITNRLIKGYAAINKNLNERLQSSSGGIFPLLSKQVINNGGVVVGCAMEKDCKSAKHIIIENKNELERLYGSKYLQSNMNDVYISVKKLLENNKKVLFSGTPCQVYGLKTF